MACAFYGTRSASPARLPALTRILDAGMLLVNIKHAHALAAARDPCAHA